MQLDIIDLGIMQYAQSCNIQRELAARRAANEVRDTLLLVEHPHVYTMGRNANEANLLLPRKDIADMGIDIVETDRGGDVTYHGPGQLVCYPILHLAERAREVSLYVRKLEGSIIEMLCHFELAAQRDHRHRGVWIGDRKIAAVGVRIAKSVTTHGCAINVRTDLSCYRGIVPCGIRDRGLASMHELLPDITIDEAKREFMICFKSVFGYD